MAELYWITRLDAINNFIIALIIISILLIINGIIGWIVCRDANELLSSRLKKSAIISFSICMLFALLKVFIPTTKEALIIYGAGGVIEYVQSNETVKELPDKAVQCLDKLLDEYVTEENNN